MEVDAERLTRVFKKMRAARAQLAKDYKQDDDDLKAKMAMVQGAMLKFLLETKQDAAKSSEGVFYKQLEHKAIGSDWGAFYAWVKETDSFDYLEKRIKVTEVVEYMKTHAAVDAEGNPVRALPPGVSLNSEWVVRVRQANVKEDGFDSEGED